MSFAALERWSALFLLLGTAAIYLAVRIAILRLQTRPGPSGGEWAGLTFIALSGTASMASGAAGFWLDARLQGFQPMDGDTPVAIVVTLPRGPGRFDIEWRLLRDPGRAPALISGRGGDRGLEGDRWSLLGSVAEIRVPWMDPESGPVFAMPERIVGHWSDPESERTHLRSEAAVREIHPDVELLHRLSAGGARGFFEPMLRVVRRETEPLAVYPASEGCFVVWATRRGFRVERAFEGPEAAAARYAR